VSNCNLSTTTSFPTDFPSSSIFIDPDRSDEFSSLDFENNSTISKFQISHQSGIYTFDLNLCHNSLISKTLTMEEDCEDSGKPSTTMVDKSDLNYLFAALTDHLTLQTDRLHDKFHQVTTNHDNFKMEVRQELDDLRALIQNTKTAPHESSNSIPNATIKVQDTKPTLLATGTSTIPLTTMGSSSIPSHAAGSSGSLTTGDLQSLDATITHGILFKVIYCID
jgi:hypothetical protein